MAIEPDDLPTGEGPRPSELPTAPGVGGAGVNRAGGAHRGRDPDRRSLAEAPTGPGGGSKPSFERAAGPLTVGHDFGSRYHIIRLLGIGGMGAVYQAWDKVLEVAVAVKVIRPPETAGSRTPRSALETPIQARAAPGAAGHAQARRPHPRSRRDRRHHVHHDAVRPGIGPGDDPQTRGPAAGRSRGRDREADRGRARRRARGRRRPPRSEARQHHGRRTTATR